MLSDPVGSEQVTPICVGAADLQEDGKALQRDLHRLHRMRFSKAQCWLLHLGHSDSQGRRLSDDCWCQLLLAVFQLSLGSPTDLQNLRADPAVKGQPCCCLGGRLLTKVRTLPHLPGFSPEHRDAQHLIAATCIDNADETRLHCWNSKGSPIPPPASHLIFLRTLTSFLSIFLLHQSSSSSQGCRDPPALLY